MYLAVLSFKFSSVEHVSSVTLACILPLLGLELEVEKLAPQPWPTSVTVYSTGCLPFLQS